MALSKVSIANMALTLLGADRIISLDDDSKNAREIKAVYDIARDEVLSLHTWNFALKRVKLAQLAEAPAHGYTYQYALPTDYLRKVTVYRGARENDVLEEENFRIENKVLLTNESEVYLKYIFSNDDPTTYSPTFAKLFAMHLASLVAYSITNNGNLLSTLTNLYNEQLRIAMAVDAQESSDTKIIGNDYLIEGRL
jgi:hypothetical protein